MNVLSTTMRSALGLCSQIATYTSQYVISTAQQKPLSTATAVGVCAFQATRYAFSYFVPYGTYEHLEGKNIHIGNVLNAFRTLRELSHEEVNSQKFEWLRNAISKELLSTDNEFQGQEKSVFQRLETDLNKALSNTALTVKGLNKDEQRALVNFYERSTSEGRAALGAKANDAFKSIQDNLSTSNQPLTSVIFSSSIKAFAQKFSSEINEARQIFSNNKFKVLTKLTLSTIVGATTAYFAWLKIMSLDQNQSGLDFKEIE